MEGGDGGGNGDAAVGMAEYKFSEQEDQLQARSMERPITMDGSLYIGYVAAMSLMEYFQHDRTLMLPGNCLHMQKPYVCCLCAPVLRTGGTFESPCHESREREYAD